METTYLLLIWNLCLFYQLFSVEGQQPTLNPELFQYSEEPSSTVAEDLPSGLVTNRKLRLTRGSFYTLRDDLIIDSKSELILEAGVKISFAPMVGITVHGIFQALGSERDRIILESVNPPSKENRPPPQLRLVDGASTRSGRLQAFHNGAWRSVCSNSRRWSRATAEVACRQMGWQGGHWLGWADRLPGIRRPRLLLQPRCAGNEETLTNCLQGAPKQLGGSTCDFHPDVMLECYPQHVTNNVINNWRGLRFENAKFERRLTAHNTFYIPESLSKLQNVDIIYAGSGRGYNTSSAVEILGVSPLLYSVKVTHSAYNGINITQPRGPVSIINCTIANNRGYGLFINSSDGGVLLEGSTVADNDGDGVRYISHQMEVKSRRDLQDLCTLPTTAQQTFPMTVALQQSVFSPSPKDCHKYFFTQPGYKLTVNFLPIWTERNGSTVVTIHDGVSSRDPVLASLPLYNNTQPQSVTSTGHNVFVAFTAQAYTETYALVRITSGLDKWVDLNVTDSTIADNKGRGIAMEKLRSRLVIARSSVSHSGHIAGVHVLGGAGHVNITESRVAFNIGDGVNISWAGGSVNVSRTSLSSNQGSGLAVWFNKTQPPEYIPFNTSTVLQYSEVFRNLERAVLVGNFCREASVNITGNSFNGSLATAVEVESCLQRGVPSMKLYIGHNDFFGNKKICLQLRPAVNLEAVIEFNKWRGNLYGGLLVKNDPLEVYDTLPASVLIRNNEFYSNTGQFVVSIGLSSFSYQQTLLFTWNFVKDNKITQPFHNDGERKVLIPRSRVAAPIVVSSGNAEVYRNIIQNHESEYEIGAHLQDQSQIINCTYNWLGHSSEEKIFYRIFDRKNRYNLAKVQYLPYLLHSSNPGASTVMSFPTFVAHFSSGQGDRVGGEVDGVESLRSGEYIVDRDINVRPGGRLSLQPGVTLRFPPGVGMMVAGKVEARGRGPNDILLTLREDLQTDEESTMLTETEGEQQQQQQQVGPPVRLIGGATVHEGTLQVQIGSQWGTVCNTGWTQRAASIVCNQLGLVLNPDDWLLYVTDVPHSGTNDPILLTNVDCTEDDYDITECRAEVGPELEGSCTHVQDVLMRCYPPYWAGLRLGVLAERSHLQYITIQRAGLLDYATNQFKPALQVDLSKHAMENVRLVDNAADGLGIVYSDIFATGPANTVKNCEFSNNRGSGISFKQVGLKVSGSRIENNRLSGIRHDPVMSGLNQRELAGWFRPVSDMATQYNPYTPILVPQSDKLIEVEEGSTRVLLTQRLSPDPPIETVYYLKCSPGFVIGVQLLNPIHNRSTERLILVDSPELQSASLRFDVYRDLNLFPFTSSSYGLVLLYQSGADALGGTVLVLSAIRAPQQTILNRIVRGPVPTLSIYNSRIKGNTRGIWASYYNRYLTEVGEHYLRKCNETIQVIGCDISHNKAEAVLIDSPHWSLTQSNISEISLIFNSTLITDNGRGFLQFSRDLRNSTNLFHWSLNDNSIERNLYGGFEVSLPYVWNYNENFTHSLSLGNNTWRNNRNFGIVIGGHYARVNLTDSHLEENWCRGGLVSVQGMEKTLRISGNTMTRNQGVFMVEFRADSQSEIMGETGALFVYNSVRNNNPPTPETPSSVILFNGVQKVRVRRNLIAENNLGYAVVAGVRTARLDSTLDLSENWWGTPHLPLIKEQIFHFDDWNDHAIANFLPYLVEDTFDGSLSTSWEPPSVADSTSVKGSSDRLSGRLHTSLTLEPRPTPYRVLSDLTILPGVTLTLRPGVILEFSPRVGLLVLGRLEARGVPGREIVMRPIVPLIQPASLTRPLPPQQRRTVRLCRPGEECKGTEGWEWGFLERWNETTQQWVPVCDTRFSERNGQVACRQLGRMDPFVSRSRRWDLQLGDISRIWSWHEPLQCTGEEHRLEECEIRLNGQVHGHIHRCSWDSEFVFMHCGQPRRELSNWGGIRFANSDFEQSEFEHRLHDTVTHTTMTHAESVLHFVNISGAGLLHSGTSPAILAVARSPHISYVNITGCLDHGIALLSPTDNVKLLSNRIENNMGMGVVVASLTGEGRESDESSFSPLRGVPLPYGIFSLVEMCDPAKEMVLQERILLYYVYDNRPINCVKIFHSAFRLKPFGFRLLQFNLLPNSTDRLDLYDGSLYNRSLRIITSLTGDSSPASERRFYKTRSPSFSVRLVASAASRIHGFLAEIVTLPISAIGFNRDVQHNISYSVISGNKGGGVHYVSAGEVNPRLTLEYNQFENNCLCVYGNFTTCPASLYLDLQNTQNLHFRNNLVRYNEGGGVWIRADSRGSATALKGWLHNNLFADNLNLAALSVEGRQSSPYQQVEVYRNFWTRNTAQYHNTIKLIQVVSNFTFNYLYENTGAHILEVSGFDRVRLPIYQSTSHNSFYWNTGVERESRGTVIAGTAGQQYVDNIFFNPDNDYEVITVNRSLFDVWQTPINAKSNWWGFNQTLAVMGRIRDRSDRGDLLEVDFLPFLNNNASLLDVKCPPPWALVGDTCYMYIGAPMSFFQARDFCRMSNASLPYVMGNLVELYRFLRRQQETYQYYDRVWVQHIDRINQCTVFTFQRIETDNCNRPSSFICEMDPKVVIDALSWRSDVIIVAMMGSVLLALLLVGLLLGFWVSKSRHRQVQRLERRNSIRQSLHSVRSFGSSHAFNDMYRRGLASSTQSSPTLNKSADYKKMAGSLDSIEKSQFNSSNEEETQSYDIYEAHNPARPEAINHGFHYRNQGFRDNSTFASRDPSTWQSEDYLNNSSTLPLTSSIAVTDSTLDMGRNDYQSYYERPKSSAVLETNLDDSVPLRLAPVRTAHSEGLLDSGGEYHGGGGGFSTFQTAGHQLSKSQPLETAM